MPSDAELKALRDTLNAARGEIERWSAELTAGAKEAKRQHDAQLAQDTSATQGSSPQHEWP